MFSPAVSPPGRHPDRDGVLARRSHGLAVLMLGLMAAMPCARAESGAEGFVARIESGLRAARAAPDASAREAGCAAILLEAFDRAALAEAVAGGQWATLTTPQRAALAEAIGGRMHAECRALMARPDPGASVLLRTRESAGALRVTTQLPATDGTGSVVTWTLAPGGPWGLQARDVVADGRGLAATLRAEFEGALASRQGDVAAAIADLGARRAR